MTRYSNISLNMGAASLFNAKHIERSKKPNYLLFFSKKRYWVDVDSQHVENVLKKLLRQINSNRKLLGMKKVSSQTHILKEFVVNLDHFHTPKVMSEIAMYLEERYGFKILQLGMHADEGVIVEKMNCLADSWNLHDYSFDADIKKWLDKNGKVVYDIIVYRPGNNIFWSQKTEKWYHDREYTKPLDMRKVKYKINYHGHILVLNLDEKGNSIARTLRPYLTQMQKDIANITGMPMRPTSSNRKGERHYEYKSNAVISAKVDEVKRKNMMLYNHLQLTTKQFGQLNPTILKMKNSNEKYELIKKTVNTYIAWKRFAIKQYQLLGFEYLNGDTIKINEALKNIEQKLDEDKKFIEEIFKILNISGKENYDDALKKLRALTAESEKIIIPSLLYR